MFGFLYKAGLATLQGCDGAWGDWEQYKHTRYGQLGLGMTQAFYKVCGVFRSGHRMAGSHLIYLHICST